MAYLGIFLVYLFICTGVVIAIFCDWQSIGYNPLDDPSYLDARDAESRRAER